eukprot:5329837-Pleurochrysis_carterae.AAC.1
MNASSQTLARPRGTDEAAGLRCRQAREPLQRLERARAGAWAKHASGGVRLCCLRPQSPPCAKPCAARPPVRRCFRASALPCVWASLHGCACVCVDVRASRLANAGA